MILVKHLGYLICIFYIRHDNETTKDNAQAATNEHNTTYDEHTYVNGDIYGSHLSQNSVDDTDILKLERGRTKFVFTKFITWVHVKV